MIFHTSKFYKSVLYALTHMDMDDLVSIHNSYRKELSYEDDVIGKMSDFNDNFCIVYGISGYGLGENLDISAYEGKQYIEKYLSLYPEVNEYMKSIVEKTRELGYVRTIFNRKREIDEIKNTNYLIRSMGDRMALNTPIQGSAADILKLAMIKIDKLLKEKNLKTKMILQVHDELIFDTPNDELDEVQELVRDTMENIYKLSVPLKVGMSYGKDWYEAK